jgi:hypothetical protein|tara:strand:+ start:1450 stop:1656 length:207 start_codon:yes stop_codon:yes gene_type:complete
MFSKQCKSHLKDVNENGIEHMWHAIIVAFRLQLLVPVLLIHAIIPSMFTTTGSNVMKDILKNRGTIDE